MIITREEYYRREAATPHTPTAPTEADTRRKRIQNGEWLISDAEWQMMIASLKRILEYRLRGPAPSEIGSTVDRDRDKG